ncbi:MAG TPA: hypothetical protein VF865_13375, partial [Acidobacteriaceae bacterium]
CSATVTTNCNPVLTLTAGFTSFTPTSLLTGTHHYSFAYSGDSNFQCSVQGQAATANCPSTGTGTTDLIVDTPDFTVSSTTSVINIIPGIVPSGNGLPPAANQSTAAPESAIINISAVLGFVGNVSLTCTTQHPSYVTCFMTPQTVCFATTSSPACTNTLTSTASVLAVQTPATLPLGFSTGQVRMSTTKTVLAFLPFGVLAFCVRRRRRLSQALWMLIAIAAVSAGMSGCGGNQVDFFTPVPTGPQTVTVTGTFASTPISGSVTNGSTSVTGVSSTTGLYVGEAISGSGIPANTTITSIGSGTLTLSASATATASAEAISAGGATRSFTVPININ